MMITGTSDTGTYLKRLTTIGEQYNILHLTVTSCSSGWMVGEDELGASQSDNKNIKLKAHARSHNERHEEEEGKMNT